MKATLLSGLHFKRRWAAVTTAAIAVTPNGALTSFDFLEDVTEARELRVSDCRLAPNFEPPREGLVLEAEILWLDNIVETDAMELANLLIPHMPKLENMSVAMPGENAQIRELHLSRGFPEAYGGIDIALVGIEPDDLPGETWRHFYYGYAGQGMEAPRKRDKPTIFFKKFNTSFY